MIISDPFEALDMFLENQDELRDEALELFKQYFKEELRKNDLDFIADKVDIHKDEQGAFVGVKAGEEFVDETDLARIGWWNEYGTQIRVTRDMQKYLWAARDQGKDKPRPSKVGEQHVVKEKKCMRTAEEKLKQELESSSIEDLLSEL